MRTAVIFDVHGNLAALEAVLADAAAAGAEGYAVGGDLALFGPEPAACVDRLRALPDAVFVQGNTDRYLAERRDMDPVPWTVAALGDDRVAWLASLPTRQELAAHDALVVHATPRGDEEVLNARRPTPRPPRWSPGVTARTLLVGHVHLQYRRPGRRHRGRQPWLRRACPSTATAARPGRCSTTARSSCGARPTTATPWWRRWRRPTTRRANWSPAACARPAPRFRPAPRAPRLPPGSAGSSRVATLQARQHLAQARLEADLLRLVVARVLEPLGQVPLAARHAALAVRVAVAHAAAELLRAAEAGAAEVGRRDARAVAPHLAERRVDGGVGGVRLRRQAR